MKILLFCMTWMLFSAKAEARHHLIIRHQPDRPLCEQDVSDLRLPVIRGILQQPEGLVDRGLLPSLKHIQEEVCRCLPRRPPRQPEYILVQLHIKPNEGEVKLEYVIATPWTRPQKRMMLCLGEPTLNVEPMKYGSDIITEDGPMDEVLGYPIEVDLGGGVHKVRSRRGG